MKGFLRASSLVVTTGNTRDRRGLEVLQVVSPIYTFGLEFRNADPDKFVGSASTMPRA